jgi:hypothetical protein
MRHKARSSQSKWLTSAIAASLGLMMLAAFLSCGGGGPNIDPAKYKEWSKSQTAHFNFYFSPTSTWKDSVKVADLTNGYERFMKEICAILEMPIPDGKIDLYIYASDRELKEMTGTEGQFSNDHAIHWGGLYPYGYQLTKFLLEKKGIKPGQFRVMNEGVPNLLDYSGFNYHDKTNRLVNSKKFVPLAELGDNARFDSLGFTLRRAEAASFCGFIMFNYGLDRLFMLWQSSVDWKKSIETIFQMPLDEFEKAWIAFARNNTHDPEGNMDNDTSQDMRINMQ